MSTKRYSQFDDLITFTRASNGTALRPISYGSELVTNGTFDTDTTGWTSNASAVLSLSSGKLQVTRVSSSADTAYQVITTEAGALYQISVDVTAGTQTPHFKVYNSTIAGTNIVDKVSTGDGTYVVSFIALSTATAIELRAYGGNGTALYDNVSVKEVLFDQPDGTLTLFNHPNNIPRIEYDSSGNRLGLLIEESRTNLITYSESLSQQNDVRCTVTDNQAISPSGNTDASSAIESTASADHRIDFIPISVTSGASYTFSIHIKQAGRSWVRIQMGTGGFGTAYANFNLSTGAVGTTTGITAAQTKDMGNGFYRCEITATATATASTTLSIQLATGDQGISYTGDGTSGIYIYGAQLEAGSFPTSYIPTSGATATRSADVASISTDAFGFNADAGTLLAHYHAFSGQGTTTRMATLHDGSASNSMQLALLDAGTTYHEVRSGGVAVVTTVISGAITDNALTKTAVSSTENDHAGVTNGGTVGTDTSGAMPIGVTTLNIGAHYGGNFPCNGHIKEIRYYPRRLTNAQLVEITS